MTVPTNKCEMTFMHIGATAITLIGLYLVAMHTQPHWAPFDKEHRAFAAFEGRTLAVTKDLEVFNRYPVSFTRRAVHPATGAYTEPTRHGAATAQTGRFVLSYGVELPAGAVSGRWCLLTEATIHYNWIRRQVTQSYDPVCAEFEELNGGE